MTVCFRALRPGLLAGLLAALVGAAGGAQPGTAAMEEFSQFCPLALGADPAIPPTLRLAVLWRMPSLAEQISNPGGFLLQHPSMARALPAATAEVRKNPRARLDFASWDAGAEVLAGRHDAAQRQLDACLVDATAQRDSEAEAACANNLGVSFAARGRYAEAQSQFERAARRYREARDEAAARPPEKLPTLPYPVPAEMVARVALQARLPIELGVMRASLNQGHLAMAMGQLAAAERHLGEALKAAVVLPSACAAVPAADLARLYRRLDRRAEADTLLARHPAPPPSRDSDNREGMAYEMGRVALAPSTAQAPTAPLASKAPAGASDAVSVVEEPMSIGSESALQDLLAAAGREEQAGRTDAALAAYSRVALRALAMRRTEIELSARNGLMRVHTAAGRPGAAAAQGKRAVLLVQQLHQGEGGVQLDRAARRTLLRQRQEVHATVVRLLLGRQRLAEAEQVLQMLKQDEGLQFTGQRSRSAGAALASSAAEQAQWARTEQAAADLRRLDTERRAVADDFKFPIMLQVGRVGIEQARLQAAAEVVGFLRAPAGSELERALRDQPAEVRTLVKRLMAGKGEVLSASLRNLVEDAPQFTDARASPAQIATANEAARRAGEFHVAFSPVFARLLAEPAPSALGRSKGGTAASLQEMTASAVALGQATLRQHSGGIEKLQKANGVIMMAYMAAVTGQPAVLDAGALDAAVQGLAPEALESLSNFSRQQASQMAGAVGRASPDSAAPLEAVQRQVEAVLKRARPGPLLAPIKESPRKDFEGAFAALEMTERLWRLDQARERSESAFIAADRQSWPALESPAAQAVADDTVATLARMAPDAAVLHFLPGDDRVDILLVTARGRETFRAAMPRAVLDERIARLQELLRQPRRDPRSVARELHDALIAPLQPALAAAGVRVLVLSLHDKLRFVPYAALHDGQRWLAERYAIVVQPGARLQDLLRPTSPRWRVAAFGASAGGAGLPPLPAVPAEVRSVVGEGSATPRGQAWIDRAFDAAALRGALAGQHQVLHIAGHFSFAGGNAAESFLLLGDGGRLSLQQLGGAEFRFERLELVALSACQTGLSQDDAYGQEVDGLAALLMAQGARAVLASLWQVNDESTGQLMSALYRLREGDGVAPLPLAEALRQAQVAMIRGDAGPDSAGLASRGAARRVDGEAAGAAFAGKSHPHHWAPFVLMGNWR